MFRRGKSKIWYFHDPVSGKKVSSGTTDKARAGLLYRKLEQEAFDRKTGRHVETFGVLADRWMGLNAHLANYRCQQDYDGFWRPWLEDRKLTEIDEELVHRVIMAERKGVSLRDRVSANATANLYVWFVAKIIRFGKVVPPKFYKYPAPKGRKAWLRPEEWARLRASLSPDLRRVVTFALATGLRRENVIGFRWEWLHGADDKAFLPPDVTKTDEDYGIPFGRVATSVIAECRRLPLRHATHVFVRADGRPWDRGITDTLQRACARAGVPVIGLHGLRHTFRSWLTQEGVSDSVVRRLGCWQLASGADSKYLHFDVEWLREFAEKLDPLLGPVKQKQEAM